MGGVRYQVVSDTADGDGLAALDVDPAAQQADNEVALKAAPQQLREEEHLHTFISAQVEGRGLERTCDNRAVCRMIGVLEV